MLKIAFILSFFTLGLARAEVRLRPFVSDGCSRWPDGTALHPDLWRECCYIHDLSYWMGGTKEERLAADQGLRACVKAHGAPINALLMFEGVRAGGGPMYHTSYRWGYGWPELRPYGPLKKEEKAQIVEELNLISGTPLEMEWLGKFRALKRL